MGEDVIRISEEDFQHFRDRCKYLYKIRSEDNRLIDYHPNSAQKFLDNVRKEEFSRSKDIKGVEQCKIILLKSRQVGGTTDTALYNLDIMLNLNMAYGLVLAHNLDSTPIIYKKYQLAYEYLPDKIILTRDGEDVGILQIKPKTQAFSAGRLEFGDFPNGDKSTESRLLVRTAGSGDSIGRGDTLNFFHASEGAFYDYFSGVMNAVNQSMPSSSFVYSVIESTANGVSGIGEGFYNLWKTSTKEWKKYQNGVIDTFEGYRPVFIPWYKMEKYRMPLVNGKLIDIENVNWQNPENKQEHLQMEEKIIEEIFDDRQTGLEAVNWYRWCIKENCEYNIKTAWQEYPTTPDQAFKSTDQCFFDTSKLFVVKENFTTNGEPESDIGRVNDYNEFVKEKYGDLKVWEHPKEGWRNRYVVSCDPAEGRDGDYTAMFVFDRLEEKFVAKWYGNVKEDIVAEELLKLAYYYNEALIVPERNLTTVIRLIEPGGMMPYTGDIYEQYVSSRKGMEYGFYTGNNKKDLLMQYNAWLNGRMGFKGDYSKIPDVSTLDEHITFIKEIKRGNPKYHASEDNHDDMVISCALCIEGHDWWSKEIYNSEEKENPSLKKLEKSSKSRKTHKFGRLGFRKKHGSKPLRKDDAKKVLKQSDLR